MDVAELFDVDATVASTLLQRAHFTNSAEAFGEAFVRGLDDDSFGHRHFAIIENDCYSGLAAVAPDTMEMVVDPEFRRQGVEARLSAHVGAEVGERLLIRAHGDVVGVSHLVELMGYKVVRELLQTSVSDSALEKAAGDVDKRDNVEALTLIAARAKWGAATVDRAWLVANNEAFGWHPEQGGWLQPQLGRARGMQWSDPESVFFVADVTGTRDGAKEICGFHWTKWYAEESVLTGEVYVTGLSSKARGHGLRWWLTNAGPSHLRNQGVEKVTLYIEDDDAPAVCTYRTAGPGVARRDVMYGA